MPAKTPKWDLPAPSVFFTNILLSFVDQRTHAQSRQFCWRLLSDFEAIKGIIWKSKTLADAALQHNQTSFPADFKSCTLFLRRMLISINKLANIRYSAIRQMQTTRCLHLNICVLSAPCYLRLNACFCRLYPVICARISVPVPQPGICSVYKCLHCR